MKTKETLKSLAKCSLVLAIFAAACFLCVVNILFETETAAGRLLGIAAAAAGAAILGWADLKLIDRWRDDKWMSRIAD